MSVSAESDAHRTVTQAAVGSAAQAEIERKREMEEEEEEQGKQSCGKSQEGVLSLFNDGMAWYGMND